MSTSYDAQREVPRGNRDESDRRDSPDLTDQNTNDDARDRNDLRDRDHDGVPDSAEQRDRDHDGVPDSAEQRDRDHDGVPDSDELRNRDDVRDRDHDGVPDRVDPVDSRDLPNQAPVTAPPPATAPATAAATAADLGLDRRTVVARERATFGGIKIGSAFFGWLTATGTAVLLTALMAGIGVAVGLTDTEIGEAANQATRDPESVSLAGAVVLIVILFVSYYCGGYVAGRMARFNGAKQGLAVWLWAVAVAVVVAVVAATAGDKYDVLARLNGFPRLPINEGDLPMAGIVTALALVAASLVGAILGGLAGMRYHRRVDRVGLEPTTADYAS